MLIMNKKDLLYEDKLIQPNQPISVESTEESVIVPDDWSIYNEIEYGVSLEESVIFIQGDIILGTLFDIIMKIRLILSQRAENDDTPITIVLNSDGGDVYEALGIIDYFHSLSVKVNIIARGRACSAAALLLACTTGIRAASKYTFIMVHELSTSNSGTATDIKVNAHHVDELDMILYNLLAQHTTQKKEYWEKVARKDFYMTAEKAVELGVIDQII
jgi:ATP-dependent Clp protease protease subunit